MKLRRSVVAALISSGDAAVIGHIAAEHWRIIRGQTREGQFLRVGYGGSLHQAFRLDIWCASATFQFLENIDYQSLARFQHVSIGAVVVAVSLA